MNEEKSITELHVLRSWTLQSAEQNLHKIIHEALTDGPQLVSGVEASVVVLSLEKYVQLSKAFNTESLVTFFQNSPLL
jgi:hypothetical protein